MQSLLCVDKFITKEEFMKKFIIAILIFLSFGIVKAEAKEVPLEEEYLKNVYFVHTSPKGEVYTHQQAIFRLDGKIAYCLEPNVAAMSGDYRVTEGLSGSYLSDEKKALIEEFGYYGYEYPGHQKNTYYLAAQELIWETVSEYEVTWRTSGNKMGTEINIEKEKQEILNLIVSQKKLPSFAGKEVVAYEGESLVLEDDNQVLKNFEITSSNAIIENNNLKITNIMKSITVKGKLSSYDNEVTLLYRQEDSQKLATLRLSKPTSFELNVDVEGVSLKIHKIGEEWKGIYNTGNWSNQNGIEFDLYAEEDIYGHQGQLLYKKGDYIETLVTKSGMAQTRKLPKGHYYLIETKGKEGYSKIEHYSFEIDSSVEKNQMIELKNYLSTGKVEIIKKDSSGKRLSGVIYGLYSKNGRKIDEKVTDQNGKIVWERLPIGEYQIKELKTLNGYQIDSTKLSITVTENKTITLERTNVPLLPNTASNRNHYTRILMSLCGVFFCKKVWEK